MSKTKTKKETNEKKESKLAKFKELWAIPRYKALIKLGMYAIFFATLFLISYISRAFNKSNYDINKNNNNKVETEIKISDNYNYEYVIQIIKNEEKSEISYKGTETVATNSGIITYSTNEKQDSYVLDKTTGKIYINGIEKDKIYDDEYAEYLSLKSIKEKINKSEKVNDTLYIYKNEDNNVNIKIEEQNSDILQLIVYIESQVETNEEKTLTLKFMNIK